MNKISAKITDLIGHTPIIKLDNYMNNNIFAKLEFFNPLGSIKDRIALAMIEDAEKNGQLKEGSVIVEPTSGNTGIGLAGIGASKGYKVILTMPESMSEQRKSILRFLGAQLILTPAKLGMTGAIDKALEILNETKNAFMPRQFENPVNPNIHEKTTALEILNDTNGEIDFFVAGVGTGGTISGVGKALKKYNKNIKVIAVEPKESSVISGGKKGIHGIQGIGAGFIPKTFDRSIIDDVVTVKTDEAIEKMKNLASIKGLLVGISSGAALCGVEKFIAKNRIESKNIVTIFPDGGERYL